MSDNGGNGKIRYEDFLLPDPLVEEVQLPSGMPAKLKPPGMTYYLRLGTLPGRLAALAANAGLEPEAAAPASVPLSADEAKDLERRSYLLISEVFLEPRFVTEDSEIDKPNHIFHARSLSPADTTFVSQWATKHLNSMLRGGRADLETFRDQPGPTNPGPSASGEAVVESPK